MYSHACIICCGYIACKIISYVYRSLRIRIFISLEAARIPQFLFVYFLTQSLPMWDDNAVEGESPEIDVAAVNDSNVVVPADTVILLLLWQ